MTAPAWPAMPPSAPQHAPGPGRRLARWLLERAGWRVTGTLPDLPKLVLIGAPHSSWWDGIWGLLAKVALGADIGFMVKRELFFFPLGTVLRRLGGIPIERSATHGIVDETAARFRRSERFWLGITPEGTRKRVTRWKTGFWHIARKAGVPILPIYFHYPDKTIGIGAPFVPSDDLDADLTRLRAFYAPWRGRHRGTE
ncbi:Acyltransferase family protein [Dokdonella koreensis DS-123]|uniref:Acyltransferase family protein n=2 Tax=Dokdonella TaxID=323413 RepID=A0A167HAR1_9GAMM|nr:lysophospholipid acyltransferase family protein [Dokdonella koreensis]ANB19748.1 Acyltransferase family protein [Dokdonella koreensis DS-123]